MVQQLNGLNVMDSNQLTNQSSSKNANSILIIEDNFIIQYAYRALFETTSHRIKLVATGNDALQKIKQSHIQQSFDLILLDIQLPDISGIQLCQMIRELEAPHKYYTPIIAVSSKAEENRNQCIEAGCDWVIDKSVGTKLTSLIDNWMLENCMVTIYNIDSHIK